MPNTILSAEILSRLPPDFDANFYLFNHPDLQAGGINTELGAINHYVNHGYLENRLYKRQSHMESTISEITNISINSSCDMAYIKQIVLFTQFYQDNDPAVTKSLITCLKNNINNPFIEYLCIFLENDQDKNILPDDIKNHDKVIFHNNHGRISYSQWIKYANKNYKSYIKILANSDIYFDETLQKVLTKNFNSTTMYAITRKDLDDNNNIVLSHDAYNDTRHPTNPHYSHDVWIYQNELSLSYPAIPDFKLGFANCDRLFKQQIEDSSINFINLYPQINAIHLDRRTTRNNNRPSYDLNKYNLINIDDYNISNYLQYKDLKSFKNKLENICLLLHSSDELGVKLDNFIDKIIQTNNKENREYAQNIDFRISTQHTIGSDRLTKLKDFFRSVEIDTISIPEEYDYYQNPNPSNDYGYKSGPNYAFFKTINLYQNYNTTLFLETDVIFGEFWLRDLAKLCEADSFWISGASNDCDHLQNINSILTTHINGGVCLYNTGNGNFQAWINFCHGMLPYYVKYKLNGTPYDYLLNFCITDFFNHDKKNRKLWQYILRQYQNNNLIYNLSAENNSINIEEFTKVYNFALLHKKLKHGHGR